MRVLVLDDNADYAGNLAEILDREGDTVRVAHRLEEVMPLAGECPDIAFVDVRLPDGDGRDFVRALRDRCPQCLAIVLTGNATMQSAIDSVNAGAFGFLLKDMPVEAVLATYEKARERIALERQKSELEAKLNHQQQLAVIGQMAATLAHEIKNPLTGIAQALEVLLDATSEPESLTGLKSSILSRFRALNDLVEDLLQFSKPVAVDRIPVDVEHLCRSALADVPPTLLREVETRVEIGPGAERLMADERHLRLLLANLLRNAAQAMEGRPERRLEVGARLIPAENALELYVADSGPGVAAEDRDRLFEPFFTTRTRGTGLGLALARRIAEEHGGRIQVANRTRGGARFSVTLPLRTEVSHAG